MRVWVAVGRLFTHGDKRLLPHVVVVLTRTAGLQELGPKGEYSAPALRATDFPRHFLYLVTLITKERESTSLRKKFIFKAPLAHPALLRPPGFVQFSQTQPVPECPASLGGRGVPMKEEIFEVPQNERGGVNESSGAVGGSKGVANK